MKGTIWKFPRIAGFGKIEKFCVGNESRISQFPRISQFWELGNFVREMQANV